MPRNRAPKHRVEIAPILERAVALGAWARVDLMIEDNGPACILMDMLTEGRIVVYDEDVRTLHNATCGRFEDYDGTRIRLVGLTPAACAAALDGCVIGISVSSARAA